MAVRVTTFLEAALLSALLSSPTGRAHSQTFSPAMLVELEGAESLECPVSSPSGSIYFCEAAVNESGLVRYRSAYCFSNQAPLRGDGHATRLIRAVRRSRFQPAQIDRTPVKVYVSFRVVLQERDQACNVDVIPNFGLLQSEYGLNYIAAQELIADGSWVGRVPYLTRRLLTQRRRGTGVAFSMSVAVDEYGQASDGRIELNNSSSSRVILRSIASLEASEFIPVFVDGVPQSGRYFTFIYLL